MNEENNVKNQNVVHFANFNVNVAQPEMPLLHELK